MRHRDFNIRTLFRKRDESGVALIMAVAVTSIFVTVSASLAVAELNNVSSVERGVLSATSSATAQAGLNYAISTLQSDLSTGASLPCTLSGTTTQQSTGQTLQTYSVALSYYSSVSTSTTPPTVSGPITCTSGSVSSSSVAAVSIVDAGKAGTGKTSTTTMDAFFSISQASSFLSGYGIYDGSGATFNNGATVGTSTNSGLIYVDGPVDCNSATINGTLYVNDSGNANATTVGNTSGYGTELQNSCTITGGLDSNSSVYVTTSSPRVTGNALVQGSVSIQNSGGPFFKANVTASSTINQTGSGYIGGTATQNATVTLPTALSMPVLAWNQSAWTSAGWTVDTPTSCGTWQNPTPVAANGTALGDIYYGADSGTPTVIYVPASCDVDLPQNVTITMNTNLAIVDAQTSGIQITADDFVSSSSTTRDLYLIVPADPASPTTSSLMSVSTCGSNYAITAQNQEEFGTSSDPVDTLIYDPCDVSFTNNGTLTGQIVAGDLSSVTNNLNFSFLASGSIPGTTNSQGSLTPLDQYVISSN
jgi:hypothetical protein